MELSAPIFLVE